MSDFSSQIRRALSFKQRLLTRLLGIGIVVVFGVAVCLKPDSKGFGTHQQLGLPEPNLIGWPERWHHSFANGVT